MNIQSTILGILFSIISFSVLSQSKTEFDLKDFKSIDVGGAFYIEISQGDQYSVTLECEEDLLDKIDIHLSGEKLKISIKGRSSSKEQPKVSITMPNLVKLEVSGASIVKLTGLNVESMDVEISGASELQGDLNINEINIDASGASTIGLSGKANKLNLYLSGASSFNGKGFLITDEFLADFSGASSAYCQVDGDMFLKMTGASSLSYHGEGSILKQETSGASSISKD